jgi:sugar (pentulose or hexulose) kinase
MSFNPHIINRFQETKEALSQGDMDFSKESAFTKSDLSQFTSGEEAYHQLILDLVLQQVRSTGLLLKDAPVKRLFVDGGFSQNEIYMNLLAAFFPELEVFTASIPQATAIGTALCIHKAWNNGSLPDNLITLKHYPAYKLHYST